MDSGAFNNRTFKTTLAMIKFNLSSCEGVDRRLAEVYPVALDISRRRNCPQHSLGPQFHDASLAAQPASFSGLQNGDTPSENAVTPSYPYPSQNFTQNIQPGDSLSEYLVDSMYISPSTLRMGNTSGRLSSITVVLFLRFDFFGYTWAWLSNARVELFVGGSISGSSWGGVLEF